MYSKLTFVMSVVLVLAMASVVPAEVCIWEGTQSTSWYDEQNWANNHRPGPGDDVWIIPPFTYIPIIVDDSNDIDVNVGKGGRVFRGPVYDKSTNMSMEIAGGTVLINGEWRIVYDGSGIGTVTISGGDVTVKGKLISGQEHSDYCIINFTGGQFTSTGPIELCDQEHGGGELHIGGDANVECGGLELKTDEAPIVFTMTGGNLIINGGFTIGTDDDANVTADLDRGNIYATDWSGSPPYKLDINDVNFIIKGYHLPDIQEDIDDEWITGRGGTETPVVIYKEGHTYLGFDLVQEDASNPDPRDGTGNICPPDVNLSWTPGVYVADYNHNIYFGTSMDDVNESASPYETHVNDNNWTTPELKVSTTYYWRVEEVNDACAASPWPGSIWRFSTKGPGATYPWPNGTYGRPTAEVNELVWTASCFADDHKVYFGDDFRGSFVLFEDDFSRGSFDPNWTKSGDWDVWYPNEPNFYPHDNNLARATGTGTLEMDVSVDLSDACAFNVHFDVNLTKVLSPSAELQLLYYNGSTFIEVADWNYVDANAHNNEWFGFGRTLTRAEAPEYMIDGFKFQLKTVNLDKPVYIDDVKITNTWPAASKWFEGREDSNSYSVSVVPRTRYRWRIDTVVDGNTYQGSLWTFSTGRSDPGVLLHYSFTGTQGNDLPDYPTAIPDNTGNFEFYKYVDPNGSGSVKYGASNPIYGADGGTSAAFDPCAGLYRLDPCAPEPDNPDPLRLDGYQYTIEMWIRPQILLDDDRRDIYLIGKSGADTWTIYFNDMELDGDNDLRWEHRGSDIEVGLESFDWDNPEWLHIAVVFDMSQADSDNQKRVFIYGEKVADSDSWVYNAADNNKPVAIGFKAPADGNLAGPAQGEFQYYLKGLIDEVRILDIALHPSKFLLVPGPEWASYPHPYHRALDIDPNDANVVLSWAPGTKADKHKVFLSTDFDDVNTGSVNAYLDEFDVNEVNNVELIEFGLEFGEVYYWRVDEVNDGNKWEGVVWRFTTKYLIGDPNRILWYRFNEDDGLAATDASGYGNHGAIELDGAVSPDWEPEGGRFGGCLAFDGDISIDVPDDVLANELASISDEITISVWLYGVQRYPEDEDEDDELGDNVVLEAGDDGNELDVQVPDDDGYVYWRAGDDVNDALTWEVDTTGWQGDWHHLAFVKDESADKMYIYFDGGLAWSKLGGTISSLSGVVDEDFTIGEEYEGKMDDFRVYNIAKPESEIVELYRGGDLASAWGPSPYDGQTDAPRDANLAWNAGDYADSHDVYFGTDYEAVRDANTSVTLDVFRGNTTDESNDIEILKLDTYYYWRVDEVNDPNKWKGNVWKFKVADYLIIDDMESYENPTDIRQYWLDQDMLQTGYSRVVVGIYDASNPKWIPHAGDRMMRYFYKNFNLPFYSEAYLPLEKVGVTDWTEEGVKALTLFFYGQAPPAGYENHDQMYVGISSTDGNYAEIRYGDYNRVAEEDINDLNEPDWHEWFIGLSDFNDPCYAAVPNNVDFEDVNRLFIGFGNKRNPVLGGYGEIRFDDIRLNRPICRPEIVKPVGDFSGRYGEPDCIVDIHDIGYIAESEWLRSDANFVVIMEEPCDANLLGHWKLDGDPCDSSSYDHYGYIDTTDSNYYSWVVGHTNEVSDPALEFTGTCRLLVPDRGATPELRAEYEVSVSAWVYSKGQGDEDDAHVVVKGREDHETYAIEVDDDGDVGFSVRDANGKDYGTDAEAWREEWMHVAGTYDGNAVRLYVNAWLRDTEEEDANFVLGKGWTLSRDDGHFAIGNRSDDTDSQFKGVVDEVRVYDYGLDANEVAWLATDGEGITMLRSPANIYDLEAPGEKAVNFKDIALLIKEHWLEEIKWPQ